MKRNHRRKIIDKATESQSQPAKKPSPAKRSRKKPVSTKAGSEDEGLSSPYFQGPPKLSNEPCEPGKRLDKTFYNQSAVELSRSLLGKVLCRKLPDTDTVLRGTVVETEAYPGVGDAASKSSKGVPTPGNAAMFMDPGTAYVYFTYGMYYCFNVSAKDKGGASLFRAVEPHQDYEDMHLLRKSKKQASDKEVPKKRLKLHELCNGPAKLCLAFSINHDSCDKIDMAVSQDLWLEESSDPHYYQRQFQVSESKRVGIDNTPLEARNKLYRFYIDGNASVSKAKFKE